jgi:hypothetical protein
MKSTSKVDSYINKLGVVLRWTTPNCLAYVDFTYADGAAHG